MARKTKFDNIDEIMNSAAMSESEKEFSHAKIDKNTIQEINTKNIEDNPFQPRLQIKNEDLIELANSIKENGLLQPIVVNKIAKNKYEVIAGHRRLLAHKLLKRDKIKAIVSLELSREDQSYKSKMAINALIENIQRENLDILETAISLQNLLNEKIYKTKQELSKAIGKNNTYISKILSILKLEAEIIKDLEENKSLKDLEVLYELQKIKDSAMQIKLYYKIIDGKYTRAELREYNKKKKNIIENKNTKIERPYSMKISNNTLNFKYSLKSLEKKEIDDLQEEIKKLVEKYLK